MKKYLEIFRVNLYIYFVYRLSFVLWRVRNVLNFIVIYFLWSSVYDFHRTLFAYSREEMLTYILIISVMNAVIMSTRTTDVAQDIANGSIMNYLLKPFSIFSFVITKELVDKVVNGLFAILEITLFIILINPEILIQTKLSIYPSLLYAIFIGGVISFFISLALSFVVFWTAETWAPRFIYFILVSLLAGTSFPLDILPEKLYSLLLLTPFPYLMFLPVKIYVNGVTSQTATLLTIGTIWAIALYFFVQLLWKKGIKEFSFYGK
jgi:ABC-2 type transport system permease protein